MKAILLCLFLSLTFLQTSQAASLADTKFVELIRGMLPEDEKMKAKSEATSILVNYINYPMHRKSLQELMLTFDYAMKHRHKNIRMQTCTLGGITSEHITQYLDEFPNEPRCCYVHTDTTLSKIGLGVSSAALFLLYTGMGAFSLYIGHEYIGAGMIASAPLIGVTVGIPLIKGTRDRNKIRALKAIQKTEMEVVQIFLDLLKTKEYMQVYYRNLEPEYLPIPLNSSHDFAADSSSAESVHDQDDEKAILLDENCVIL